MKDQAEELKSANYRGARHISIMVSPAAADLPSTFAIRTRRAFTVNRYAKTAALLIGALAMSCILPTAGCESAVEKRSVNAVDKDHRITRVQATGMAKQILRRFGGNFDWSEPVHVEGNAWIFVVDSHGDQTVGGHFFIRVLNNGETELLPGA